MKLIFDPQEEMDFKRIYHQEYNNIICDALKTYEKIKSWIESNNDMKNYYAIKFYKGTISFRLNNSREMTFDITLYEDNFFISISEKLLELIEFKLDRENIKFKSFLVKEKDQFMMNNFNKLVFDIVHKSLTSDILLKNDDWSNRLRRDMRKKANAKFYEGEYYDFLREETDFSDTEEGIHQYIREVETYIRLHIKQYPVSPEYLKENVRLFYHKKTVESVLRNIEKYVPFYIKKYH